MLIDRLLVNVASMVTEWCCFSVLSSFKFSGRKIPPHRFLTDIFSVDLYSFPSLGMSIFLWSGVQPVRVCRFV